MGAKRKKTIFNLAGGLVVLGWLVMMGALVKENHFSATTLENAPREAISAIEAPQRDWMDIFFKDKKVGYAINQINPVGEGYLIREEIFLRLNLMGLTSDVHTVTQSLVDQAFLLKHFNFSITSGLIAFQSSGHVEENWISVETGRGKAKRVQRVKLSGPPSISASLGQYFKGRQVEIGQSFRFFLFDPSTMSQRETMLRVAAKDTLRISGIDYPAYRLESEIFGHQVTFWVDNEGSPLKEEGFMGLSLVRSNAARAPRGIAEGGANDFYEVASIKANRSVPDARRLAYLKVKLEGVEDVQFDRSGMNDDRQRFQGEILEVKREEVPAKNPYLLPYAASSGEMSPFLSPEFNIESDEESIIRTAREIKGDIRDPVTAARKILRWVYRNVEKKPVVSVPSALEVLEARVGDCNEHAALLIALLRASGIPARFAVGVVYARGKFFYHAWTEAYLGRWVSMDATLDQMPADASHIKMVQGGLDKQVEIIQLVGRLRLEIIDYGYD